MGVQTGTKISIAGHGLLVGWAAFGAWFTSDPLPFQVQEVAVISAEDFAKLSAQAQAPEVTQTPSDLVTPLATSSAPEVAVRPEPRPQTHVPDVVNPPSLESLVEPLPDSQPDPEVSVKLPEPGPQPEPPTLTPTLPETAQVRPADRVAPVPVEAPEPEVTLDDLVQPEIAPDQGATHEQDAQEATAPEAASDRIATEANTDEDADQVSSEPVPAAVVTAPTTSVRPKRRPQRSEPSEALDSTPPPTAATAETSQRSAIEDALATAIAGGEVAAAEPAGPPLTAGEKDALRISVSKCWNVGSLSSEALKTTVEVAVSLQPDGKILAGSVRMVSSTGGSSGAAKQAYEAARRAIIRCGAKGFVLPIEKYDHWRDIVMTFNPEKMRIK